jgi:multiple sugar transport system substrate-binding protein
MLLLALIMAAIVPGAVNVNAEEKVTITFSGHGDQSEIDTFRALIKVFEAQNPDIKVDYTPVPSDYVGKMNTMLLGGTGSDVFYVPDDKFGGWVKAGFIQNIQSYLDASEKIATDDIWESAVKRYRYDGTRTWQGDQYGIPKDMGPTVMYYNKQLFIDNGVELPPADKPWTWDQFLDACKKLSKDLNGDGKNDQFGVGPIWWEAFVLSNGGKILSDDFTEFLMWEDDAAAGLQFAADLTNVYDVCPNAAVSSSMSDYTLFFTGRVGMIFGGRWYTPAIRAGAGFDWDVCLIPSGKENIISGWSGTVGLCVWSGSQHPEEAWRFIEFLASVEGQTEQTKLGFCVPIYKSLSYSDLFLQKDQKPASAEVFLLAAENQIPTPNTWLPDILWWDTLSGKMSNIWRGRITAKDALTEAREEIQAALEEGNPDYFK